MSLVTPPRPPAALASASAVNSAPFTLRLLSGVARDHQVGVAGDVGVAEPKRDRLDAVGPQLLKGFALLLCRLEERPLEVPVRDLLEAGGGGVLGRDAGAVRDHPDHVPEKIRADLRKTA